MSPMRLIRYRLAAVAVLSAALALGGAWGAPKLPDSPSNRMDVWKGEVIASFEEELLA